MERDDFIHFNMKILSGRTVEQKKALGDIIISNLPKAVVDIKNITLEIIDMDKETYKKF